MPVTRLRAASICPYVFESSHSHPRSLSNIEQSNSADRNASPKINIGQGDEILLHTTAGISRYEVDWIPISAPGDGGILSFSTEFGLTLVTCYSFYYIGAAPERFVIHGHNQ
jgi:sortase A